MGIIAAYANELERVHANGATFETVLTLGRLHDLRQPEETQAGKFVEDYLRAALGAQRIDSIDASPYEGASLIHDLNDPIPKEWEERYDAVIDGGTLEHVFNFPEALRGAMRMVKPGGHLFLHLPANNSFGHGFYQLSPELFFRALSKENGFRVAAAMLYEHPYSAVQHGRGRLFMVVDPEAVASRVTLISGRPCEMIITAVRERSVPIFQRWPQQSDYATRWRGDGLPAPGRPSLSRFTSRLIHERSLWRLLQVTINSLLPPRLRRGSILGLYDRYFLSTIRNRDHFTPLK